MKKEKRFIFLRIVWKVSMFQGFRVSMFGVQVFTGSNVHGLTVGCGVYSTGLSRSYPGDTMELHMGCIPVSQVYIRYISGIYRVYIRYNSGICSP